MTATYEREAEEFIAELEEEYFQNGAGFKQTFELSSIYEQYAHLFTRDRVEVQLAKRATKADRYLAQFAGFQHIGNSTRAITQEIANAETQATLEWDGESVPYRRALALLPNEPDRGRRRDLCRRTLEVTRQHDPTRAERFRQRHREVRSLGFADSRDFCEQLLGIDLHQLALQMHDLLARTREAYHGKLAAAFEESHISPETAEVSDLRYLLLGRPFDSLFPEDRLLHILERTLAYLGIDLASQTNLRLDTAKRPLKSPRAFCCTVRVPSDVRLVIMPKGGLEDYNTLFHEMGHAQHFAHTDEAVPFAFRRLGDGSVTEGYAFLFNLLLNNPAWHEQVAETDHGPSYLHFSRFCQLYYVRRHAAKLIYEIELHEAGDPGAGFDRRYSQILGDALEVSVPQEDYLADVDDHFQSACYLRGWMLEAQLRRQLESKFGAAWLKHAGAGEMLRGLWRQGQRYDADELARQLGYQHLDPEVLISDLIG